MNDLRAHQRWPELLEHARASREARVRVLEVWPDGNSPAELSARDQLLLESAETAVRDADQRYRELLASMQADLDVR